jgi:NitT/TauT family transport system substrate-binding protein
VRLRLRLRRLSPIETLLRRSRILSAAAAAVVAGFLAGVSARAQTGAAAPAVRLAEIARQDIFLPLYGALGKGFFRREGLEVTHKITLGPDHTLAALLDGEADIALGGPDTAIVSAITAHGEKIKVIAAISRFEGSFLVAHQKIAPERFRWDSIKGRTLMGWHTGTLPAVFLEGALRNRHIDSSKDIEYWPNVPYPARMRTWRQGSVDFATFYLVDAARLEREGAGYPVVPIGPAAGRSVYTVFLATADYIRAHPDVIQKWANAVQVALRWTASAPLDGLVATAAPYLPRAVPRDLAVSYRRYRPLGIWQADPTVSRDAIAMVQAMMIASDVMAPGSRVAYETVVEQRFAENAKRAMQK